MKLDRRDFLFLAGGAAGGAAAGRLSLRGLSRMNEALAPEMASYPGEEKWVTSICRLCPGGCGLRVRTVGGRPVKVNGNPFYPSNREGICSRGQALLQWLYHPDRILQPQWRGNTRQKYEAIPWDQALEILAARLRKLSAENRQSGLVVVTGRGAGLTRNLLSRFPSSYGSKPLFCLPVGTETAQQALELMTGSFHTGGASRLAYDLENARTVLNFGCDMLEGWGTPAHTLGIFGRWRDGSNSRRTTLIHFGSRLSVSAARANEWVPVEPGTLGAVALGLAYVLISEGLYNREFIDSYTTGFEDWTDSSGRQRTGFRRLVRAEYRLSRVSEMTGVAAETLVRIARQFASGPGAVAIGPQQSPTEPGRLFDAMSIHSLNALAGSIGAQGGVAILPCPRLCHGTPSPTCYAPAQSGWRSINGDICSAARWMRAGSGCWSEAAGGRPTGIPRSNSGRGCKKTEAGGTRQAGLPNRNDCSRPLPAALNFIPSSWRNFYSSNKPPPTLLLTPPLKHPPIRRRTGIIVSCRITPNCCQLPARSSFIYCSSPTTYCLSTEAEEVRFLFCSRFHLPWAGNNGRAGWR